VSRPAALTGERIAQIVERLSADRPVRRAMPVWGRLHVDRQLPFIVVYRRPADRPDAGTDRLAVGFASYLLTTADIESGQAAGVLEAITRVMRDAFGAFLILEVWAGRDGPSVPVGVPAYRVCHYRDEGLRTTLEELRQALAAQKVLRQRPEVTVERSTRVAPPGMRPLFTRRQLDAMGAHLIGVEVAPVYRDEDGNVFPIAVRQFARRVATAIDRAAYRFATDLTNARPRSYLALGRRAFVKAVKDVDAALVAVGSSFDPLLLVTPVNSEAAWSEFRRSRYQKRPQFHYRPLPIDPGRTKHALWSIRPERVEDPTLLHLFRDVQVYFDRRIDLLLDIERARFVHTSLQLYGGVEPGLLALARQLLGSIASRAGGRRGPFLTAEEFAGLAASEILCYRESAPRFGVMPEVRDDIYSGLMVSRGQVYVGSAARIPARRADALIQHEIGTHVVTFYNGRAQPLQLLRVGLPGYDELQEGLAVLGEYLVGGLNGERIRVLAARVVAVASMIDGADFVETFRVLIDHGLSRRAAFTVTTRVYRGGGFTKDAMYLRGLAATLDYVAEGCDFERLFLGKFGLRHVAVIDELLVRNTLLQPQVLPRYLERPEARERLARLRAGMAVSDLEEGRVRRR